jgi:hypothetical protein
MSGTTARKYDAGKAPVVQGCFAYFPRALEAVAHVSDYGRTKYATTFAERNWFYLPDGVNRYTDGLGRHLLKEMTEGTWDEESGLAHAAHAAWNALARLESMLSTEGVSLRSYDWQARQQRTFDGVSAPTLADDEVPF